jgi:hypothetical protein
MYFQTSISILILTLLFTCSLMSRVHSVEEEPVEYGVDVSFPIHNTQVSTNYPWLPHNVDPANHRTPAKYKNMPLQVLGDRDQFYKDYISGCNKKYPKVGFWNVASRLLLFFFLLPKTNVYLFLHYNIYLYYIYIIYI